MNRMLDFISQRSQQTRTEFKELRMENYYIYAGMISNFMELVIEWLLMVVVVVSDSMLIDDDNMNKIRPY